MLRCLFWLHARSSICTRALILGARCEIIPLYVSLNTPRIVLLVLYIYTLLHITIMLTLQLWVILY